MQLCKQAEEQKKGIRSASSLGLSASTLHFERSHFKYPFRNLCTQQCLGGGQLLQMLAVGLSATDFKRPSARCCR